MSKKAFKSLIIGMSMVLVLSFAACGNNDNAADNTDNNTMMEDVEQGANDMADDVRDTVDDMVDGTDENANR